MLETNSCLPPDIYIFDYNFPRQRALEVGPRSPLFLIQQGALFASKQILGGQSRLGFQRTNGKPSKINRQFGDQKQKDQPSQGIFDTSS